MFEMIKKFFELFFGSKPVTEAMQDVEVVLTSPPTTEEEMKRYEFLFPETLTIYKVEKARLREEIQAVFQMWNKLNNEFSLWFESNKGQITNAVEMLGRRQIENGWRNRIKRAKEKLDQLEKESCGLETNLKRKDLERYLLEGTEICRSSWEETISRIVVKWQDKILLLELYREPIQEIKDGEWVRTGFKTPFVRWATESLARFEDKELEAVVRFQSGMTN